jgi:hypothetical protein
MKVLFRQFSPSDYYLSVILSHSALRFIVRYNLCCSLKVMNDDVPSFMLVCIEIKS